MSKLDGIAKHITMPSDEFPNGDYIVVSKQQVKDLIKELAKPFEFQVMATPLIGINAGEFYAEVDAL